VPQPLYPLYGPDDPTLRKWQADVAELWDVRVVDLAGQMDRMKVADAAAAQHAGASPPYRQEGSPYAAHGSPPYAAPPSPHSSAWDGARAARDAVARGRDALRTRTRRGRGRMKTYILCICYRMHCVRATSGMHYSIQLTISRGHQRMQLRDQE
jgi:hypothetical protein